MQLANFLSITVQLSNFSELLTEKNFHLGDTDTLVETSISLPMYKSHALFRGTSMYVNVRDNSLQQILSLKRGNSIWEQKIQHSACINNNY